MNKADFDRMLLATRNLANEQDSDAVLFLGNPTDPIPRALIIDSDLPFEARVLWCYFRSLSDSPGASNVLPDYATIQKELGIGRRNTVSNCLTALYITRWITIMPQAGQQRRIFVLHDTPLTFDQAVEVNPAYTDRLSAAIKNPVRKIRSLAQRVLDGAIEYSGEGGACADLYRLSGFATPAEASAEESGTNIWSGMFQREKPGLSDADEKKSVSEPAVDSTEVVLDFHDEVLAFSPGNKKLAALKLEFLPAEYRQAYLDDLAVQVLQKASGDKPIRKPIGYLQWMVNRFVENDDVVLSGEAENLGAILSEMKRKRVREDNKPILAELHKLRAEYEHLKRLARYSGEPDVWMNEKLDDTLSRISELEGQLLKVDPDGS